MRGINLISLGWRGNHLKYCKLQHILQQPYLWQSSVKSPSVWTWRPWGPGSSPSMVPSIKQRPSDSCRKRTTPWILPRPASMATADPRSVTKMLFLRLSLWLCAYIHPGCLLHDTIVYGRNKSAFKSVSVIQMSCSDHICLYLKPLSAVFCRNKLSITGRV